MKFGFDPEHFRLHRIPAPSWALTPRMMGQTLPDAVVQAITEQLPAIDRITEQHFQWAMTDPVATARFQDNHTYGDDVVGAYFVGRQHFGQDNSSPNQVIVETECCLTNLDSRLLPAIYQRYLVVLDWDLSTSSGALVLAHDTERDGHIDALTVAAVRSATLSEIPAQDDLSEADRHLLTRRWSEFLACVQEAAQEAIDIGSASGQVDDSFFPSRLTMTGEYKISQVHSPSVGEIGVDLRFTKLPWMTGQAKDDYLGYDLSVFLSDSGDLRYELWGSRAL